MRFSKQKLPVPKGNECSYCTNQALSGRLSTIKLTCPSQISQGLQKELSPSQILLSQRLSAPCQPRSYLCHLSAVAGAVPTHSPTFSCLLASCRYWDSEAMWYISALTSNFLYFGDQTLTFPQGSGVLCRCRYPSLKDNAPLKQSTILKPEIKQIVFHFSAPMAGLAHTSFSLLHI